MTRIGLSEMPGFVRIYLYSSRGIPSIDLLANGQQIIDGWRDPLTGVITPGYRAGGVRVDVLPMVERAVDFAVGVEMLPGYSLTPAVVQQLGDIFATVIAGVETEDVLYVGTIVDELLGVTGVKRVVPASNENIVCGANETLVPGEFTATAL
ncbi:hypothetical protein D3C76_1451260 [compost metagenome]